MHFPGDCLASRMATDCAAPSQPVAAASPVSGFQFYWNPHAEGEGNEPDLDFLNGC
jgi:hypothetical protein